MSQLLASLFVRTSTPWLPATRINSVRAAVCVQPQKGQAGFPVLESAGQGVNAMMVQRPFYPNTYMVELASVAICYQ